MQVFALHWLYFKWRAQEPWNIGNWKGSWGWEGKVCWLFQAISRTWREALRLNIRDESPCRLHQALRKQEQRHIVENILSNLNLNWWLREIDFKENRRCDYFLRRSHWLEEISTWEVGEAHWWLQKENQVSSREFKCVSTLKIPRALCREWVVLEVSWWDLT